MDIAFLGTFEPNTNFLFQVHVVRFKMLNATSQIASSIL